VLPHFFFFLQLRSYCRASRPRATTTRPRLIILTLARWPGRVRQQVAKRSHANTLRTLRGKHALATLLGTVARPCHHKRRRWSRRRQQLLPSLGNDGLQVGVWRGRRWRKQLLPPLLLKIVRPASLLIRQGAGHCRKAVGRSQVEF